MTGEPLDDDAPAGSPTEPTAPAGSPTEPTEPTGSTAPAEPTVAAGSPSEPAPRREREADVEVAVTNLAVRRALLVASGVVIAAWLVVIAVWKGLPYALTFDDAWYYLTIGRNLANGAGSTFDGLNPTNGYHPLWQGIATLPFRLGLDDLAAARALLVVQLVAGWGVTLVFVSATVARVLRAWPPVSRKRGPLPGAERWAPLTLAVTLAALAGSPFIVKVFVNGLESGVAAALEAALVYLAVRTGGRWVFGTGHGFRLGAGALLALTFLARTDAAILIACLGLWCVAECAMLRPRYFASGLAELFGPPAATIAVYLWLNNRTFGTPWQVSGLVKRAPLTASNAVVFAVIVAAAGLLGWRAFHATNRGPTRTGRTQPRFPAAGELVAHTGWFGAFCVVLVGYYTVLQSQQWLWYYAPVVLYALLLGVLAVADMAAVALRDAKADTSAERALVPVQVVLGVLFVALAAFTVPQFVDPNLRSIQQANADAGRWMRANLPEDAVIASWDAGALGYFSHRHVFNIDGVVNSYDYYRRGTESRTAAADLLPCGVPLYVANHGADVNGGDPDIAAFIATEFGKEAAGKATVVHRRPFTYSGVLASTAGLSAEGNQALAVHVYQLPPKPCR